MVWDPNSLSIDIAEEFASFADLSREDFRREMRVQQRSERLRERRRAKLGKSKAIVKRNCAWCGNAFDDVIHRNGSARRYCCTSCQYHSWNRVRDAQRRERRIAREARKGVSQAPLDVSQSSQTVTPEQAERRPA